MGEAPVKKTHSTGVSEEIRKINLMKMKRIMMMKSTMRDQIQTYDQNQKCEQNIYFGIF